MSKNYLQANGRAGLLPGLGYALWAEARWTGPRRPSRAFIIGRSEGLVTSMQRSRKRANAKRMPSSAQVIRREASVQTAFSTRGSSGLSLIISGQPKASMTAFTSVTTATFCMA
jgi:hypothetical protein